MFITQDPTHCPKCQSKTCEDYRTGGKNHLSFAVIGLAFCHRIKYHQIKKNGIINLSFIVREKIEPNIGRKYALIC